MSDTPDAETWEERIRADFANHPGSWQPDPQNWYREGWLTGYAAGVRAGGVQALREAADDRTSPTAQATAYLTPEARQWLRDRATTIQDTSS
jgi:hypothetical protein